jgi:hypothetical protein
MLDQIVVTIGLLEEVVVQHLHHQVTLVLILREDLVEVDEDLQIQDLHYQHQEMKWMQSKTLEVVEEHSMGLLVVQLQDQVVPVSSSSHIPPNK